jgi:hypothetical protein
MNKYMFICICLCVVYYISISNFRTLISINQVKEDEMGRAFSTNGEKRNVYRIFVVKREGKRPLGRPRLRWVNNINLYLKERGWDCMDWIDLAQDKDR